MGKYAIGIDYGTESARAVLVNITTGAILASEVHTYADGVIDRSLPHTGIALPPDWALQNAEDWLKALEVTVCGIVQQAGVDVRDIIGLGVDFTSCTILPTDGSGIPLSSIEKYCNNPHAWVKLWKHHAAQPQAERINELAKGRGEKWLARYGGAISSEWVMPKALQVLEEAPDIYRAASYIVEGGDWIVWQLTDKLVRSACSAGYKAAWNKADGYPSSDYLEALNPEMKNLFTEKLCGPVQAPGSYAGGITAEWAKRLGLVEGTAVGTAMIDAHAAALGGGVRGPDTMFMIMGTSTCHMLMSQREVMVEGIAGIVEDGIMPGLFGYEAGQAGVGDIFAWFVENGIPPEYHDEAKQKGVSLHDALAGKASCLKPGQSGLLALDWWNGNRSTLVDAELSGALIGATLATKPEEIYRTLVEATAFGTREIIETLVNEGVPVNDIIAGGGLTKNEFLMQIYADITGFDIAIAGTEQSSALGAAVMGAVAAGKLRGGYDTVAEAVLKMVPPPQMVYHPVPGHKLVYDVIFREYQKLYDYFGRGKNNVMKVLRRLRNV